MRSIDLPAGDLDGEADCYLDDMMEGDDLGSQSSIQNEYERLHKPCSEVNESELSSVAGLF